MAHHLERLFDHLEWANGQLFDFLEDAEAPPPEALRLLNHILGAERVWLRRVRGEGNPESAWPKLSLEEGRSFAEETLAGYRRLLEEADEPRLAEEIWYENFKGEAYGTVLQDILLHVVLHGAHHRGQIAALLRTGGGVPVSTEFITFARENHDRRRYAFLEVDADLVEALEGDGFELEWRLNLRTGAVVLGSAGLGWDGGEDEEYGGDAEAETSGEEGRVDEDDLIPVRPLPGPLRFGIMEDFVESLPEGECSRALARALRQSRPWRTFKDTLRDFEGMEKPWYAFKEARMRELAQAWLDENVPGALLTPRGARNVAKLRP